MVRGSFVTGEKTYVDYDSRAFGLSFREEKLWPCNTSETRSSGVGTN